ncbi:MAG: sensor histidine kinase [Chitinophagaceae bacterium]
MFQLSTKTIIILAAVCFLGAVSMQAWWIRSAYQGELSMYKKEKMQLQSEVETNLRQEARIKEELNSLLTKHKQTGTLAAHELQQLLQIVRTAIEKTLQNNQHELELQNFGIASHKHEISNHDFKAVVFANEKDIDTIKLESAGKICLYCILRESTEDHEQFNYHVILLFGNEKATIYKKLAVLIIGSLLFLLFLSLLFRLLLKKYRQEKTLSEAKNDFINNLSHEIQTPVFAVQMANKIIKEKTVEQRELQPLVSIIEKETQQLKQHAGKILELASLENEQPELNLEIVELNSFIHEKQDTLELMLRTKDGKLKINSGSAHLLMQLDKTHFNNVLVSLCENAIKYNHGIPEVCIETGEKNDMMFMRVKDNGIGIDSEYLPYVFDKFYRVPGANGNKVKGFGLGLSYVRQIIKLHRGSVKIESEPGTGTAITVLLPKVKSYA